MEPNAPIRDSWIERIALNSLRGMRAHMDFLLDGFDEADQRQFEAKVNVSTARDAVERAISALKSRDADSR